MSTCHDLPRDLRQPSAVRRGALPAGVLLGCLGLALALAGCGAGVIAGGVLGGQGGDGSTETDSITVTPASGPVSFLSTDFVFRDVLMRGPAVAPDYDFQVWLELPVPGDRLRVRQDVVRQDRGGSAVQLQISLVVDGFQPLVSDPLTTRLETELVVRGELAAGGPVETLFRTPFPLTPVPRLQVLDPAQPGEVPVISVDGDQLTLLVDGLPDAEARNLEVDVIVPNPQSADPDSGAIRLDARVLSTEDGAAPDQFQIVCQMPQVSFPARAALRVLHTVAGPSSFEFFGYRPEVITAVPRREPVDGGEVVNVIGRGLVPYDFSTSPAELNFDNVTLRFTKGGRTTVLTAAALLRSLSSLNSLVFEIPPSPDGRPGPATVEISLRLPELGPQRVTAQREALVAYAASDPDFEPRGVTLPADPVATAVGRFRSDPSTPGGIDLAVLRADSIGVPFVQLYEGRGAGSFTRVGAELRAADRGSQNQRRPVDLVAGSFGGDPLDDVLVLVEGGTVASHSLVVGQDDPAEPLVRAGVAFSSPAAPVAGMVRTGDPDGEDDLVVLGDEDAHRNSVFVTHAGGSFRVDPLWPSTTIPWLGAVALADPATDDGLQLVAGSGSLGDQRLRLLYGPPTSGFSQRVELPLDGLTRAASRTVVGAHRLSTPDGLRVGLVLADGAGDSGLALFGDDGSRSWALPVVESAFPAALTPSHSLTADLDRDGFDEVVLADQTGRVSVVEFDAGGVVRLHEAVATGLQIVTDLAFGQIAAADPARGRSRLDGILVSHRAMVGGRLDARVTTLLVEPGFQLASPRAETMMRGPVTAVLPARFADGRAQAAPSDLVVLLGNEIVTLENDGFARFSESGGVAVSGLLPTSVTVLPGGAADGRDPLVLATDDGRLGLLEPGGASPAFSPVPMFEGPGVLRAATLRIRDVDGDGFVDLTALLHVDRSSDTEALLAFFPGRDPAAVPAGGLPFDLMVRSTHVQLPVEASDCDLGDFAIQDGAGRPEVAVAVASGDQSGVHFFRLDVAATPFRWVSASPADRDPQLPPLAAALGPRLLLATDLEDDGLADLVLVSRHLDTLQLQRLVASRGTEPEVDPAAFTVSAESITPEGDPVGLHQADVDGDGLADVVLQVHDASRIDGHRVAVFVLDGLGAIVQSSVLPGEHVGDGGRALCSALADVNGDGLQDLVLGWEGDGATLPDHVRVLFGTHR